MRGACCAVAAILIIFTAGRAAPKPRRTPVVDVHYSPLKQITKDNVTRLEIAWRYDTGDAYPSSEMECDPLVVDGVLYATTPKLRLIALDAATGKLKWAFDSNEGRRILGKQSNRGVAYWTDGQQGRIYFANREDLYAIDTRTGKPVPSFGIGGHIDLREGLGRDAPEQSVMLSSPPVIYQDLLIMGSVVPDALPSSPGHIRAYDVRTGKLRWTFHTIPQPGETGYETWPAEAWTYIGGASDWAGMTLDARRGIVFAPTGSAAFDFYGGNRIGDNLFANSLLALDARTGKRIWHFQTVRHDLWQRGLPASPTLVTIRRNGRLTDAVAQPTKSGFLFVFDRYSGRPLFPIEYRHYPASDLDGEKTADTQPHPLSPPAFTRQRITEDMLTHRTQEAHNAVLTRFRQLRNEGPFGPPSLQGTILFPGFDGGAEWGGSAFDPDTGLLYLNANETPWIVRLIEHPVKTTIINGRELYLDKCAGCHRADLRGRPPEYPSLVYLSDRMNEQQASDVIRDGAGKMPDFRYLSRDRIRAIRDYVMYGQSAGKKKITPPPDPLALRYGVAECDRFLDPDGYPAVDPPWGTLNAINLNTGKIAWRIPLGEYPDLVAKGLRDTGSENYGGPVVTAGGLLFIGATIYDKKFRAFDKATGRLLWQTTLPAAGNATPVVYEINGREYVVIACGGGKWGAQSGGSYVAFALGRNGTP